MVTAYLFLEGVVQNPLRTPRYFKFAYIEAFATEINVSTTLLISDVDLVNKVVNKYTNPRDFHIVVYSIKQGSYSRLLYTAHYAPHKKVGGSDLLDALAI